MSKQRTERIRLLIYGMIGAILTMIGDCLLLGVDTSDATGALGQYIVSAEKISYTRIGFAGFFWIYWNTCDSIRLLCIVSDAGR